MGLLNNPWRDGVAERKPERNLRDHGSTNKRNVSCALDEFGAYKKQVCSRDLILLR